MYLNLKKENNFSYYSKKKDYAGTHEQNYDSVPDCSDSKPCIYNCYDLIYYEIELTLYSFTRKKMSNFNQFYKRLHKGHNQSLYLPPLTSQQGVFFLNEGAGT